MKALVTGATGFIGSAVVRELLKNGEEVKALVRPGSNRLNLQGLAVEEARGDVTDLDSVRKAVAGCDRVYHAAALYTVDDPPEAYYRVNVDGTRNVLRACLDAGVRRVVHTSTVAAVGSAASGAEVDEESLWNLGEFFLPYATTKYMAEFEAYRALARGLPIVVVNPTAPLGARDLKPTPTGKLVVDFLNGKMPLYPELYINVIDADDVALGHRLAMERGRPGERYILGNQNMRVSEILAALARLTGAPMPKAAIPYAVALAVSFLVELVMTRLLGRYTMFSVASARFMKCRLHASNAKAVRELGLTVTPVDECLRKSVRWFHEHGYIKRPIRVP
ncbi:MAG: NAD-dependent epimerase/dehydratase family protein [bacterium]